MPIAASHHHRTANARLQVLIGQPGRFTRQIVADHNRSFVRTVHFVDGDDLVIDAESFGLLSGVVHTVLAAVAAGHQQAMNVFRPNSAGGNVTGKCAVDASGQPEDAIGEAALAHVVAQSKHQRIEDGGRARR